MFTIPAILSTLKLAGSHLPAFKALFDAAVGTFGEHDQAKLKKAYADHMAASDAAHASVQDALR